MKRGAPLKRSTPLKQGDKEMKRSPMSRGASTLKSTKPMARAAAPMRSRSKTNSDPRPKTGEAELCCGQPCYLLIPGIPQHDPGTVVPCHSNQLAHGKAKGMKAHDKFTVPGCWLCHRELDQGSRFTREQKFALWDDAYARWEPVRDAMR
jgi:hypothetical protein